jgi:phosphate-selective porin OprO/OprP
MTLEPEPFGDVPAETNLTPQVKDAYFSMNQIPYLGRLRVGNFFVPYSLEQVTNDTNNIFLERSIPTQTVFAADREVGFAFYNSSQDERLTWTSGCFFDSISEGFKKRLDDNQGYRVSGRLTWLPYDNDQPKSRRLIHTGLGVLFTDDNDDRIRIRTRPQVSEGPRLIDSGLIKADSYTSGNVEGAIVLGRFAIQSEAFLGTVQMLSGQSPQLSGAYVHTSWFVTGESRSFERFGQHGAQFGRNAPFENFRFKQGEFRPGALELKSRWSHLDMNQLNAGQYNDLTVGFNWYWSDRTRWMFDWIHPITSSQTVYGPTVSDLLAMRFDFNW